MRREVSDWVVRKVVVGVRKGSRKTPRMNPRAELRAAGAQIGTKRRIMTCQPGTGRAKEGVGVKG